MGEGKRKMIHVEIECIAKHEVDEGGGEGVDILVELIAKGEVPERSRERVGDWLVEETAKGDVGDSS